MVLNFEPKLNGEEGWGIGADSRETSAGNLQNSTPLIFCNLLDPTGLQEFTRLIFCNLQFFCRFCTFTKTPLLFSFFYFFKNFFL